MPSTCHETTTDVYVGGRKMEIIEKQYSTIKMLQEEFPQFTSPTLAEVNSIIKEYDDIQSLESFSSWLANRVTGQKVIGEVLAISNSIRKAGFQSTESVIQNMYKLNKDKSPNNKLSLKEICEQYKTGQGPTNKTEQAIINNIGNELKMQELLTSQKVVQPLVPSM